MLCKSCGTANDDNAFQCSNCGVSLKDPVQQATMPRPDVPTHLVPAILVTLFCCQPFGIVAIVFAAITSSKVSSGDFQGAWDTSNKAKMWCWLAFWLGLIPWSLWIIFMVIGGIAGAAGA